jgi:hypothetical protein
LENGRKQKLCKADKQALGLGTLRLPLIIWLLRAVVVVVAEAAVQEGF